MPLPAAPRRTTFVLTWLAGLCALGLTSPVWAEPKAVTFPAKCSSVALHPGTGDMVATATEKNEAWLFRAADLAARKNEPAVKLRVGSSPSSVVFKQYKDLAVFAIVCLQDSNLYLMNAADGTLHKRIPIADAGVMNVTASINPEDPFVYYNHGNGHDSTTGCVNLRTMQHQAQAFDDAATSVISASGEVAYRLGPWSPSGFESLLRTNRLTDDFPTFTRLFYDHDSKGGYLPDPFDRYTAVGKSIYNRSLDKREAELSFYPKCFFRKQPLIIGVETNHALELRRRARLDTQSSLKLQAASYNTFANVGEPVVLPLPPVEPPESGADQRLQMLLGRDQMIADDARQQAIYFIHNSLIFIPLADFAVPTEPFLIARLEGSPEVSVGGPSKLRVLPADARTKLAFESLPEGMKATGNELTWTPTTEQIGAAKIAVTLTHGDLQRSQVFDLKVVRPSLELPFAPTDLTLVGGQGDLLIWQGKPRHAGHVPLHLQEQPQPAGSLFRLAVVDGKTGAIKVERKLPEPIEFQTVAGDFVALFSSGSPRCEVLRLKDLERQKSLVCDSPILSVEALPATTPQKLIVQTGAAIEVYALPTFERVVVYANKSGPEFGGMPRSRMGQFPGANPQGVIHDGKLFVQGLLRDENLQPTLWFQAGEIPTLPRNGSQWLPKFLRAPAAPQRGGPGLMSGEFVASMPLPGSSAAVQLSRRVQQQQVPGAVHTTRTETELTLSVTGSQPLRETILRDSAPQPAGHTPPPVLRVSRDQALVVVQARLYRIPLPQVDEPEAKLTLANRQTAFALTGQGKTTLKHSASGGKAPLQFNLVSAVDGVSIDEKTGDVTLDEAKVLAEATKYAEQVLAQRRTEDTLQNEFRRYAVSLIPVASEVLGRKPTGFPVAIPVRVEVTDHELITDQVQYFVLAEIPSGALTAALQVQDEKRAASQQAMRERATLPGGGFQPGRPGPGPVPTDSANSDDLRRRIESLEGRMDNITRQLNEVLRKLDERK
jgi:hypothetical protein